MRLKKGVVLTTQQKTVSIGRYNALEALACGEAVCCFADSLGREGMTLSQRVREGRETQAGSKHA